MCLFVSYPKSGRTWVRFMFDHYLCQLHEVACDNVFAIEKHAVGRAYEWTHLTGAMIQRLPYWTMGAFDRRVLNGRPAVLVVRNVFATMASAYHQAVHRVRVFDGTPSQFVHDPRYGILKLVTFYNLWQEIEPQFGAREIISYEQTCEDPQSSFRRMLSIAGVPMHDDLIDTCIEAASFDNMKQLGRTPAYASTPLAPSDPNDPRTDKVRVGGKGRFYDLFSNEDLAFMQRVIDDALIAPANERIASCFMQPAMA